VVEVEAEEVEKVEEPLFSYVQGDSLDCLDVRDLSRHHLSSLCTWMYQTHTVREILIRGAHPDANDILYILSDSILRLLSLQRIRICSNPYPVVPIHGYGISRDALHYLQHHLALDRYRTHSVEIVVDAGVFSDNEERMMVPPFPTEPSSYV
jgi:hypothetical protein